MGVTHLAIALGNYCHSKLRKKTAILELHERREFCTLCPENKDTSFRLHGLTYYPHVDSDSLPALHNRGYDYLILDLGSMEDGQESEFLRCDRKVVLGSLAPWKSGYLEILFTVFDKKEINGESFFYLVQAGQNQDISDFSRNYHVTFQTVPFIKNPFHIDKTLFAFLQNLAD